MNRSFAVTGIVAVTLAACVSRDQQFIELDAGTSSCNGGTPQATGETCSRSLSVTVVNVVNNNAGNGGCWADTVIQQGGTGTLTYPCAGGAAVATFDDGRTMGGLVDASGDVQLCAQTAYLDTDTSCDWSSEQTLTGLLAAGQLVYNYDETPTSGDGCGVSCPATGVVLVH